MRHMESWHYHYWFVAIERNNKKNACVHTLCFTELLTGNPPYFELKQEAAIYKIVMEDHPPLPLGISSALEDFLLRSFKKEENIRPSADQLLQHPWIQKLEQNKTASNGSGPLAREPSVVDLLLKKESSGVLAESSARPLLQHATLDDRSVKFKLKDVEESLKFIRRREMMDEVTGRSGSASLSFSSGVEEQRACIEQQHEEEQHQQQQKQQHQQQQLQLQQQQQQEQQPKQFSKPQLLLSRESSSKPIVIGDDDDFLDGLDGLDDIGDLGEPLSPAKPLSLQPSPSPARDTKPEDDFALADFDGPMKVKVCSNADTLDPDLWDDELFNPAEDTANEQKRQQAQIDIVKQLNILDSTKDCTKIFKACCELVCSIILPFLNHSSMNHSLILTG